MSFLGLNLAQVGLSLAQVTYLRRLLPNPTFNRSKAKINLSLCLAFRKYLNLYVRFGLNLTQVGLNLTQVVVLLVQASYFRRLLPNPTFNRSKAKINLPSFLAFRKYLNLYVLFGVKPHKKRFIPRSGRVIHCTGH